MRLGAAAQPPLTLPWVIPATISFWMKIVRNRTGSVTIIAAALEMPAAPDEFAVALYRRLGCATVVTLGARGAIAAANGESFRAPAPSVDVVDSTGAGDAFVGALTAALDRGLSWRHALASGIAAGSLACTAPGAQAALAASAAIAALASKVESELVSHPLD